MKTDIILGYGVSLRAVEVEDAAFLVKMRRADFAAPFLSFTSSSVDAQKKWIEGQQKKKGDYYFIVSSRRCGPVGAVGLYDIEARCAEWGRFVIAPSSVAALGCALNIFHFAFDTLNLEEVSSWTMLNNKKVVSFHDRMGIPSQASERFVSMENSSSKICSFVRHTLRKESWADIRDRWSQVAVNSERFM